MLQKLFGKQLLLPLVQADPAQARQIGIEHFDLSASEIGRVNVQIGFVVEAKSAGVKLVEPTDTIRLSTINTLQ